MNCSELGLTTAGGKVVWGKHRRPIYLLVAYEISRSLRADHQQSGERWLHQRSPLGMIQTCEDILWFSIARRLHVKFWWLGGVIGLDRTWAWWFRGRRQHHLLPFDYRKWRYAVPCDVVLSNCLVWAFESDPLPRMTRRQILNITDYVVSRALPVHAIDDDQSFVIRLPAPLSKTRSRN